MKRATIRFAARFRAWPLAAGTGQVEWCRTWHGASGRRYAEAQDLDQDTLDRTRRILSPDHPSTLASAGNLAVNLRSLGEHQAARDLDQDTLDRRRRILGPDHPHTLDSAHNLAIDLRALGEAEDP